MMTKMKTIYHQIRNAISISRHAERKLAERRAYLNTQMAEAGELYVYSCGELGKLDARTGGYQYMYDHEIVRMRRSILLDIERSRVTMRELTEQEKQLA